MMGVLVLLAVAQAPGPRVKQYVTPYETEIDAAVADVRKVWAVPPELVKAVIFRESRYNPRAVSKVGAIGLMQVMPFNAERLGVTVEQLRDPRWNILAGTRLLAALLKHYQGDLISALAGYNARPRKLGAPLPQNGETPRYVRAVLTSFEEYRRLAPPPKPQRSARREPRRRPARRRRVVPRARTWSITPSQKGGAA